MPELGRRLLVVLLPLLGECLLLVGALLSDQLERRRVAPELFELQDEAVELLEDDERLPTGQGLALRSMLLRSQGKAACQLEGGEQTGRHADRRTMWGALPSSLGTAGEDGLLPWVESIGRGAVLLVRTVTLPRTPSR